MTDKEKAKELASLLVGEDQNQEPLVEILMEMAQWKKEQMIKDAVTIEVKSYGGIPTLAMPYPHKLKVGDKFTVFIIKEG